MTIIFPKNPFIDKENVLWQIRDQIWAELADDLPDGEKAYKEVVKTNVPLIKYVDTETKMNVDLIVNGLLGVKNSELIHTYAKFDCWF